MTLVEPTSRAALPARMVGASGQARVDHGAVIRLALPLFLLGAVQAFMTLTDTWFVGRLSTVSMAGMNAAAMPTVALTLLFIGIGTAVQPLVAQACGAGHGRHAAVVAWSGFWMALGLTPIFVGLATLGGRYYSMSGLPDRVRVEAFAYWWPILLGGTFSVARTAMASFFNGIGRTRVVLAVGTASVVFNAALNEVLMFGAGLGIAGAAWATVLSNVAAVLGYFSLFLGPWYRRRFDSAAVWRPRARALMDVLRLGVPIGVYGLLEVGTFAVFQLMIGSLGAPEGAASHVCVSFLLLAWLPAVGLSSAGTTLVGQAIGAGDRAWARRVGGAAVRLTVAYMGALGIAFILLRAPLLRFFLSAPDATDSVAIGETVLVIASCSMLLDALGIAYPRLLRGAGDVIVPAAVHLVVGWGLFLPLAHLLIFAPGRGWLPAAPGLGLGVIGGWVAEVLYVSALGLGMLWRWRSWSRPAAGGIVDARAA